MRSRIARNASALSALAAAVGPILISAAPARADHFGIIFAPHGARFPFAAVIVEHRSLWAAAARGVHRERLYPVYYPYPVDYERPHYSRDVVRHGYSNRGPATWHGDGGSR